MHTLETFRDSLGLSAPSADLSQPLIALWWAAKQKWDSAHAIVQDADDGDSAWVHAYLHRVEGDLGNAAYWYRRAGKPAAIGELADEWAAIAAALLEA